MKYVLVSQGIKIYETTNKEEAISLMKKANNDWIKYKQKCLDEGTRYADNEIEIFEEKNE